MFIIPYMRISVATICLVFVVGSTGVWAQDSDSALQQLASVVNVGDRVSLVDSSGNTIKGKVNRLSPDKLDLITDGAIRSFSEADMRQISWKRSDSILNGFLIGAGVGFGATLPLNLAYVNNETGNTGVAVGASALWGLIGGGIGALVDSSIHGTQTMHFHSKSSVSWSVRPFYAMPSGSRSLSNGFLLSGSNSSKGLQVTLQF